MKQNMERLLEAVQGRPDLHNSVVTKAVAMLLQRAIDQDASKAEVPNQAALKTRVEALEKQLSDMTAENLHLKALKDKLLAPPSHSKIEVAARLAKSVFHRTYSSVDVQWTCVARAILGVPIDEAAAKAPSPELYKPGERLPKKHEV